MNSGELAGDLADAALTAGALDRELGGPSAVGRDGHTHETRCLNCGAMLAGAFCHDCGQGAHVHRTLGAFFHDLLHGVFHFEGRVWHTLPLLITRPGALTRRYIDGQRARFVSPLALFLFSVFLMFAAIQQTGSTNAGAITANGADGKLVHGVPAIDLKLKELAVERATAVKDHDDTDDIDAQIAVLKTARLAAANTDGSALKLPQSSTGLSFLDNTLGKVRENPELAIYKVQMHAYKFSWLLIPISVPFVWLLFPFNRRFPLYDHTVFVTYSLAFMTLLTVVVIVFDALGLGVAGALMVFGPPLHMYRQLRGAYGVGRWGGIWRTLALLLFAAIALSIFAGVIVAQSAD